jgi:predicted PurR-regulated permease PerM
MGRGDIKAAFGFPLTAERHLTNMSKSPDETFHEIRRTLVWIVCIALMFLFVWYAWELIFLSFAGLLLAIVLRTLADWIETHTRLGPRLSFTVVVCGLLVLIALTAWFVVPRLISQTVQILQIIPKSLQQAKDYLDRLKWGKYVVQLTDRAITGLDLGSKLAHLVTGMLDAAAAAIIVAVVGFYAALHPKDYANGLLRLVPAAHREEARQVASDVVYTLRWWVLGQLVPMIVLGAATIIGLRALGVPLAFTLGMFTGVMIFVPYLGALLSEIPAVLVALGQSPRTALYVVILYLGVHIMEGYILTPLVQKRAVRLLPIVTILAQFLMWILTGLLGVAIATPLAATALVLIKRLYLHETIGRHQGLGT